MIGKVLDWNVFNDMVDRTGPNAALPTKAKELLSGAVQYFLEEPNRNKGAIYNELQEFTVKGDFPTSVLDVLKKFQNLTSYDEGYKQIFDMVDFTGIRRNGFSITDIFDGLTFNQVLAGEKLKVYQMYGSKVNVEFYMHGGALGWHRTLIDDEEYWTMDNTATSFRNTYFSYMANYHYTLIEAVAGTLAWQAPSPAALANTEPLYVANRDAQTINQAAITILNAVRNRGYDGLTAFNAGFVILCPLQLIQRVREALALNLQAFDGSIRRVGFNFSIVPTIGLTTTNVYYVILPKNKLISGMRQDLTLFSDFDSLSYTDTMSAWTRFGAVIGDSDQIQRCAIA